MLGLTVIERATLEDEGSGGRESGRAVASERPPGHGQSAASPQLAKSKQGGLDKASGRRFSASQGLPEGWSAS